MNEHMIIFSTEMMRAILSGRKTQTRRICKLPEDARQIQYWTTPSGMPQNGYASPGVNYWTRSGNHIDPCPYGFVGDHIWVRESLRRCQDSEGSMPLALYDVDRSPVLSGGRPAEWKWMPSVLAARYMPRWASRITLEITAIRVERLQDISEQDAIAEGMLFLGGAFDHFDKAPWADPGDSKQYPWRWARGAFCAAWKRINEKCYPWDSNPWVWVINFKVVRHG